MSSSSIRPTNREALAVDYRPLCEECCILGAQEQLNALNEEAVHFVEMFSGVNKVGRVFDRGRVSREQGG